MLTVKLLSNIATVHNDLGEFEQALDVLQEAQSRYEEVTAEENHFRILSNQAIAYRGLGDLDEALMRHRTALELQRKAGVEPAIANSLHNIGMVLHEEGQVDSALESYLSALESYRRLDLQYEVACAMTNVARAEVDLGRAREGLDIAAKALELGREQGSELLQSEALEVLSIAYEGVGDVDEALNSLRRRREIEERIRSSGTSRELTLLEASRGARADEARLAKLEAESEKQTTELQRQSRIRPLFLLGWGVCLFLGALGLLRIWRRRTREKFIPICARCKSIRYARGEWRSLERFFADETSLTLSHGLCPECAKQYSAE